MDWPDFCPELALAKDLEVALEGTKVLEQASTEANKALDQASISQGLEQGKVGSTEVSKGLDQAKVASMEETTKDSEEMGLKATRFVVSWTHVGWYWNSLVVFTRKTIQRQRDAVN